MLGILLTFHRDPQNYETMKEKVLCEISQTIQRTICESLHEELNMNDFLQQVDELVGFH